MEVQVGRHHVLGEVVDLTREATRNVGIAEVLAHDGAVLGLDQRVVVGSARSRLGELLDVELVEQLDDAVVDVLRAVVGVEAQGAEGKALEQRFEHRNQERLRDALDRADALELGDLIDQIEVIQGLDAVQIALVDSIDADEAGTTLGAGLRRSPMGRCTGRVLSKGPRTR